MKNTSSDGLLDKRGAAEGEDFPPLAELASFYDRPGFLVRRANQIAVSSFMEDLGEFGLTPTQMSSLAVISESPRIDQITLARRIGVDRTTISMVVNGLVEHGFINREQSRQDARKKEIDLTRAGRACTMLARDTALKNSNTLLSVFSPQETDRLTYFLRRIIDDVPAKAPEWVRPDGSTRFTPETGFEKDFPEHARLYNAFGFLMRRTHQTLESLFIETTKSLGLTPRRYGVLRLINTAEPVEQISVARWLALDGSTTATLVTGLVQKGYVVRVEHPTDRRRRLLSLTDGGRRLIEKGHPLAVIASEKSLGVLGDDVAEFRSLLRRFIVENDAHSRVPLEPAVTLSIKAIG
ncbi:MarR family transcriptional regulator [uncultured Maritimibacter sp.]|jgi:DNA-binding MarR family transcriptional regulator|uniref:MarR family winged helix-turn-helix transcriptional regulator n=1 Tax=uncultured Maritimibacter sp. TaxID=991866 RepID=UPI002615A93C|nr:MarR family transcriptional regulator [uncultured Maritimibacter sp.]